MVTNSNQSDDSEEFDRTFQYSNSQRGKAWYALPTFLGLIGGLIAFIVIRYDDPRKAKNCLWIGVILTVVPIVLSFLIGMLG